MAEERTVKISDGKTLHSFLGHVFAEGFKSSLAQKALTEKEKQLKTAGGTSGTDDLPDPNGGGGGGDPGDAGSGDVDSLFGGGGAEDAESNMPDMPDTDDQPEPGGDDTQEKLKAGTVSVKDIVEKLNSIRSGKSFKDSAVSQAIDTYVEKLKKPERVALMSFLNGIAQIVTGEVPGQSAESPSSQPADVKMDKGNEPKTIQKKPNIIKGPGEVSKAAPTPPSQMAGKKATEPAEDTTPPAPIVPKKRGVK